MVEDQPKWRTGKICYIEIPAAEVARAAEFYQRTFGWRMRIRGDAAGNILGIYQQPGLAEAEAEENQHG
jgi:predicted enzyme related to lactoylglutathione lyase